MPITTETQKQKLVKLREALIAAEVQYIIKENNGSVVSVNIWIGE